MSDALTQIRAATTFEDVAAAVRRAEFSNLDSRTVLHTARKLERLKKPAPSVRVALVGTHTFQPFDDYLRVRAAASARVAECWIGEYGQYMQAVAPTATELPDFAPDILVLSAQLSALSPRVVQDFGSLTADEVDAERRRVLDHVLEWTSLARQAIRGSILLCNFPRPRHAMLGVADVKREPSELEFYLRLNATSTGWRCSTSTPRWPAMAASGRGRTACITYRGSRGSPACARISLVSSGAT
jgi:hypothetical protein